VALHRDIAAIRDDVCICDDTIVANYKPCADAALERARVPWGLVIGIHRRGCNSDKTFLDWPVWFWRGHRHRHRDYRLAGRGGSRHARVFAGETWVHRS